MDLKRNAEWSMGKESSTSKEASEQPLDDKDMAAKFNPAEKMGLSKNEPSESWETTK